MVELSQTELRTIGTLARLASGAPAERQEAIERCEAIDTVVELLREHYRDGACSVDVRFYAVPEDVWTEQDGSRAWHDGGVKQDELAPGLVVEWELRTPPPTRTIPVEK